MADKMLTTPANDSHNEGEDWDGWVQDAAEDEESVAPAPPAPTPAPPAPAPAPRKKLFSVPKPTPPPASAPSAPPPAPAKLQIPKARTVTPAPAPATAPAAAPPPVPSQDEEEEVAHNHKKVKLMTDNEIDDIIRTVVDLTKTAEMNRQAELANHAAYLSTQHSSIELLKMLVSNRTVQNANHNLLLTQMAPAPAAPAPAAAAPPAPVPKSKPKVVHPGMKPGSLTDDEVNTLLDEIEKQVTTKMTDNKSDLDTFIKSTSNNIGAFLPNSGMLPGKYTEEEKERYCGVIEYFKRQYPDLLAFYMAKKKENADAGIAQAGIARMDIAFLHAKNVNYSNEGSYLACIAKADRDAAFFNLFVNVLVNFSAVCKKRGLIE